MTQQHGSEADQLVGASDDPFLTPQAAAIAGLVLGFLSLQGQGGWTLAVQSFLGTSFGSGDYDTLMISSAVASLAMALGGFWLSRMATTGGGPSWAQHVGRAGQLLAGLGAVLAVLTAVGALLSS